MKERNTLPAMLCIAAALALFSCKKNDVNGSEAAFNPDHTDIPMVAQVETKLVGYMQTDLNDPTGTEIVGINNQNVTCTNGTLNTDDVVVDKYAAAIFTGRDANNIYLNSMKVFPVSASAVNYVNLKTLLPRFLNFIGLQATTQSFGTGNTASIAIGANTLWQPPQSTYPGDQSPAMFARIFATHIDPASNDFAVRLPCYSKGDDAGKRWFLRSYGVASVLIMRADNSSNTRLDFFNNATATMRLPIPAALLATAPDSVTKWKLQNTQWVKSGFAKKVGNYYEGKIDTVTTWNFAVPQNGIYKVVRLRTDSGAAIVNTGVRIKGNNGLVLAEGQSDADGNATVFVPANEVLTVEVIDSWNKTATPITVTTAPVSASQYVDIKISALSAKIQTIKGTAKLCDGTPIRQGLLVLKAVYSQPGYQYIAIKDGVFNGALPYTIGPNTYNMHVRSVSREEGVDTSVNIAAGTQNNYKLTTCAPATNLYMTFTFDGVSNTVTGDVSHPYTPYLIAWPIAGNGSPNTEIATANLDFEIGATSTGVNGSPGVIMTVNGKSYYNYDYQKPSTCIFTRYDLLTGGYIIGSADYWVNDAAGAHHLVANFKLRRD